jgi:NAD(P)H-hydrate epimerase
MDQAWLNPYGNEGMAQGGSGDVLTGIIGGLLAQGADPADAAKAGVLLHALAGDLAANALGTRAMKAGDLISFLPEVLVQCPSM